MAQVVKIIEAKHKLDPLTCNKYKGRYDKKEHVCLIQMEILDDGSRRFVKEENNGGIR